MHRSPSSLFGLFVACAVLCVPSWLCADTKTVDAKPGLVALNCGIYEGDCDVSWEARKPLDLQFKSFQLIDSKNIAVFCATSGQYILVADVIDWDKKQRTKTTYVVNVGGEPDVPTPNPKPDPVKPSGFAGRIYDVAKNNNQTEIVRVASAFSAVQSEIAARADMKPAEANASINSRLNEIKLSSDWLSFGRLVNEQMNKQKTRQDAINTFGEIVKGLEAIK